MQQLQEAQFQIAKEETQRFSSQWKFNGLVIPMQDAHIQFATDFANIVLRDFIQYCKQQTLAKIAQAQAAAAPSIIEST